MRIGLGLGLTRVAAARGTVVLDGTSVAAAAAFGFIRLRSAHAGPVIRVRRSSDNAEQDIALSGTAVDFSTNGAIAAFCGRATGNHGYITKWYDQSGNGYDSVQATAARQPQVWKDGVAVLQNGRPVASFDTAATQLVAPIPALGGAVQFVYVTGTSIDFSPGHRVAATGVTAPEFAHSAWLVFPAALAAGDKAALATAFGVASSGDWEMVLAHRGSTSAALQLVTTSAVTSTIDWGDGTTDTPASNASQSHSYASAAVSYQIRLKSATSILQLTSSVNAFAFDLSALPGTLTQFTMSGSNMVSGSIANVPTGLTYFYLSGVNTIGGSVAGLPPGLATFYALGSNTVTGSIASLPAGMTTLFVTGANTISGSTAALPAGMAIFGVQGANTVTGSATPWRTASMSNVVLTGGALSSAGVDNLLIALANVVSWTGIKNIDLRGNNAGRTSASNAAVATMTGLGATVLTN